MKKAMVVVLAAMLLVGCGSSSSTSDTTDTTGEAVHARKLEREDVWGPDEYNEEDEYIFEEEEEEEEKISYPLYIASRDGTYQLPLTNVYVWIREEPDEADNYGYLCAVIDESLMDPELRVAFDESHLYLQMRSDLSAFPVASDYNTVFNKNVSYMIGPTEDNKRYLFACMLKDNVPLEELSTRLIFRSSDIEAGIEVPGYLITYEYGVPDDVWECVAPLVEALSQ